MFADREEAGKALAERLQALGLQDPVVLALPRGGVPVAAEVARQLSAPLDVILVRKIGAPGAPELAAGAIMSGPAGEEIVFNESVMHAYGLHPAEMKGLLDEKRAEIAERRKAYLGDSPPVAVAGRSAIVVDDGIATGATMRAALQGLRHQNPARIVLAVPVAPPDILPVLRPLVDELICLSAPRDFQAVGFHYRNFSQVSDAAVVAILRQARMSATNLDEQKEQEP